MRHHLGWNYLGCSPFLPDEVRDWYGLATNKGGWTDKRSLVEIWTGKKSLVEINDSGITFTEIADIIESRPEGLFV